MLRSIVAVLVVLALGAGAAGAYWKFVMLPAQQAGGGPGHGGPGGGGFPPMGVEVAEVEIAPAKTTVDAIGTLLSNESVVIEPEVDGRITAINFEEGRPVTKGQVVVQLDDSMERAELDESRGRLELARSNYERASTLRKQNSGTQRALDEAQSELRRAEATVALGEARLNKLRIVAPFDGTVGLRKVSIGDYVSKGTEIVNLEQTDPLKVDFRVPELFLPAVQNGQKIGVSVDAFPDTVFEGTVYAIDPAVDAAGRAVVIRARIDNDDERLRPGLFGRVRLELSERAEALWVPEEALIPQGDKHFVYRIEVGADGKPPTAKMTAVQIGKRDAGRVEILDGLASGEKVITAGVLKVRDGAPVQPIDPNAAAPTPVATSNGAKAG